MRPPRTTKEPGYQRQHGRLQTTPIPVSFDREATAGGEVLADPSVIAKAARAEVILQRAGNRLRAHELSTSVVSGVRVTGQRSCLARHHVDTSAAGTGSAETALAVDTSARWRL